MQPGRKVDVHALQVLKTNNLPKKKLNTYCTQLGPLQPNFKFYFRIQAYKDPGLCGAYLGPMEAEGRPNGDL